MNVYDMFRALAESGNWREESQKGDVLACIAELESLNALGTLASTMNAQGHNHVWDGMFQTAWDDDLKYQRWVKVGERCRICHETRQE